MSDIFISYAREDREAIRALAVRLERRGWSVWWDRHILAGKEYDEVIQHEIDRTRCVLVAWSQHSVGSRWVKAEADEGAKRRILIPICLDESAPPLGFRNIQAVSFAGASPDAESPAFKDLVDAISDLVPPASRSGPVAPTQQLPSLTGGAPAPIGSSDAVSEPRGPAVEQEPISTGDGGQRGGGWRVGVAAAILVVIAATVYALWPHSAAVTSGDPSVARESRPAGGPPPTPAAPTNAAVRDFVRAFLEASRGNDVERVLSFYAERVDYYTMRSIGQDAIRRDKQAYSRRWPDVKLELEGPPIVQEGPSPGTKRATYICRYDVSSPARNAHASGRTGTVLVVSNVNGALKIVDQKESVESAKK